MHEACAQVDQKKTTRTVCGFACPWSVTGLAIKRCLLVTKKGMNRNSVRKRRKVFGNTEAAVRWQRNWKDRFRHMKNSQEICVPLFSPNIKEERSRSVRVVGGMDRLAGQIRQQPAVHGSNTQ